MPFPDCDLDISHRDDAFKKTKEFVGVPRKLAGILPLKIVKTWSTDTGPNVI
jgi:hypothetical protein